MLLSLLFFGHNYIAKEGLQASYAKVPSAIVVVEGMEVHCRDEGPKTDSIRIVLVHGTSSSLHTFDAWVSELSINRSVIRMNLPGYVLTRPFPDWDYWM